MAGESQETPDAVPDPSVLTTDALDKGLYNLEKLSKAVADCQALLSEERLDSIRREQAMREAHRLELKADGEKALNTAREADQKAVAAALEASEKLRSAETAAQQLATSKAESASDAKITQQQETFTLAISNLVSGLTDLKDAVTQLRSEKVGRVEQNHVTRDTSNDRRQDSQLLIAVVMMVVAIIGAVAVIVGTR